MNTIKKIVAEANFSNRAFPVGTEYASWETDEVIEGEFWRNMGISLLCVFITTVVLIQNIPACIMVLVCVVFTLVSWIIIDNLIILSNLSNPRSMLEVSYTSGA